MKRSLIYLLLLTALSLSGCVSDERLVGPNEADALETTLTLQVPSGGFKPAATRALDANNENTITEVDVLVFQKETLGAADNTAVFYDRAQTVTISDAGTNSAGVRRSFRVSVKRSDKPLQFVVLANSRALVDQKVAGFTAGVTSRTDALNALVMTVDGKWNVDPTSTGYVGMPMFGITGFRAITDAASAAATIDMTRAHARIDVTVAAAARGTFALSSVRLYNASSKGWITPIPWASGDLDELSDRGVAAAPLVYSTMTTANEALVGSVYAFESPAATTNSQNTAFVVIGGSWNDGAETFYRVDFHNDTDFMPLLRNYHYEVEVTEVRGDGFATPDAAKADSFTDRITTRVHQWAQGQMGTVVWDGKDWLAVGETELSIYPEEQKIEIGVATTVGTWSVEKPADATWLTFINGTGTGHATNPSVQTLVMTASENTSGADREAIVTVTAGRLRQQIRIHQYIDKDLSLEVGDVEVIIAGSNPQTASIRVEWTPGIVPVSVSGNAVDGYSNLLFLPMDPNTLPLSAQAVDDNTETPEGTANYLVRPTAGSPGLFQEFRTELRFTAKDGTGAGAREITKAVLLRQFDYAIDIAGTTICQQETSYSLNVRCNTEWEMDVDNSSGVLASISTPVGEPNITASGETITFRTADRSKDGQSATLTFRSKVPGQFSSRTVVIQMAGAKPNCYLIAPGSSVTIPAAKAWEVWKSDRDLNGVRSGDTSAFTATNPADYTVELLWQDTPNLVSSVGWLTNTASATDNFIVQTNPGVSGNAVVALKENGTIRWSWHVWVTNYDPEASAVTNPFNGTVFMDRNLGATSSTAPTDPADISAYGFYYQWGRKDPFPNKTTVYDISGNPLLENTSGMQKVQVTEAINMANAIRNPFTFYYGTLSWREYWYTNSDQAGDQRIDMWAESYKTEYDPCPDGWKVTNNQKLEYARPNPLEIAGGVKVGMNIDNLGYFALAGFRVASTGDVGDAGNQCFFHRLQIHVGINYANNSNGVYESLTLYSEGFVENRMNPDGHTPGSAQSIRCVKIK